MEEYTKKLQQLLEARAREYPARGEAYSNLRAALQGFTEELASRFQKQNPIEHESLKLPSSQPLFLCGPPRSGTTMFSQLLDGHPDIFMMPGDSKYTIEAIAHYPCDPDSYVYQWVKRLVNPTGQEPFWFLGPDEEEFHRFLALYSWNRRNGELDPFVAVVNALQMVIHGNRPIRYWAEKTPENELYAEELAYRFPEARFLHLVRDPLDNIYSQKKFRQQRGRGFDIRKVAARERLMFEAAIRNRETLGSERYMVLRYEDLVADVEANMRSIAGFLNIEYDPILLAPTIKGLPASVNSSFAEGREQRGEVIRRKGEKRWMTGLTKQEQGVVVTAMRDMAKEFGYEWSDPAIRERYRAAESVVLNLYCWFAENREKRKKKHMREYFDALIAHV